jgi:hypothetical protein
MGQGTRTDLASIEAMSQEKASELVKVSPDSISFAKKVLSQGWRIWVKDDQVKLWKFPQLQPPNPSLPNF